MIHLLPLHKMLASMWDKNNYICFFQPRSIPLVDKWYYAHQRWHPHPSQHCHCQPNTSIFTSLILCDSRIYNLQHNSNQRKELWWPTIHWSIPFFNNPCIWVFTQTKWYVFTWLCQCHLELKRPKGPLILVSKSFLRQKISITLQKMYASSILG
jgi:hypothetical protein